MNIKDLHTKDVTLWVILIMKRSSLITFTTTCSTLKETPQTSSQPKTGLRAEQKLKLWFD